MKRVFLFVAVNILVVAAVSLLARILGLEPYLTSRGIDYKALMAFCALWGFAGAFISLQLSRWTAKRAMGVELISPERPGGSLESRLVDTVRRLCSRAGLQTLPEIGVYPSDEVNAFATGPSRDRALVAVSTGLLERMDSSAVEGVLGHEIAHIANGDMVTMTLVQGVVNSFVMFFARLAVFALGNMLRRNDDDDGPALGYFAQMMLVTLLETAFMLLAAPLVAYFSRLREYRADQGGAEYAGRQSMIHALESLRRCAGLVDNRAAPALAAFKINGGASGLLSRLFASHPPIEARIAALKTLSA